MKAILKKVFFLYFVDFSMEFLSDWFKIGGHGTSKVLRHHCGAAATDVFLLHASCLYT